MQIPVGGFGCAGDGWHASDPHQRREVQTPTMDGMIRNGVELTRAYSCEFCSPSRCALRSGRNPSHVNVLNAEPSISNPHDALSGYAGISRNMTTIAAKLKGVGYKT